MKDKGYLVTLAEARKEIDNGTIVIDGDQLHTNWSVRIDGQWFEPLVLQDEEALPPPPAGERWIGPIPSEVREPSADGDPWEHAGGEAPAWGGYKPTLDNGDLRPHSAASVATLLLVRREYDDAKYDCATVPILEWYVSAAIGRISARAVHIAEHALQDGRTPDALEAIGVSAEEINAAHASTVK